MYRDDAEAAQLRIRSLEAKLAERDAGLAARDAEIAELHQESARFEGRVPKTPWPRVWPLLLCLGTGALGISAGLCLSTARSRPMLAPPTGIVECDLYLARLSSCFPDSSLSARSGIAGTLASSATAFQNAAQTPAGREAIRSACGQMLESLASSPSCNPQ
jgi:hypothetical protein